MNPSKCIVTLLISASPLVGAQMEKLSGRPKQGELQRVFCASRDGCALLQLINAQRLSEDLVFAKIVEAKQTQPSYPVDDPKYKPQNDSNLPKRPQVTEFQITVIKSPLGATMRIPEQMIWNELISYNGWHGPHYTAYQGLTEAGFDPFAHEGEVAFRFDAPKNGRAQFADLLIVPDGWGLQIASATAWRLENKHAFESPMLTKEQLAQLRATAQSDNPLVKKMAASLLMRHSAVTTEDMKAWLRSEPSLVDAAVAVQLVLARDAKSNVVTSPAWMMAEGERIWGGALIAATLQFAQNEAAVASMMHYHAKLRGAKGILSDDINALKDSAKNQIGYDTIEAIGAELIKTNALRNYPVFSAANQILSTTNIFDRSLLMFESTRPGK